MSDPFVHLHVASGYSLRHGANHPAELVARAAEHGMTALALTDRDGLYGAVKFALACRSAGVRPLFGVDLAVAPELGTALPLPGGVGEQSDRSQCMTSQVACRSSRLYSRISSMIEARRLPSFVSVASM